MSTHTDKLRIFREAVEVCRQVAAIQASHTGVSANCSDKSPCPVCQIEVPDVEDVEGLAGEEEEELIL